MNPIVVTWARMEARKAVKKDMKDRGEKVAYVSYRRIAEASEAYMQAHPELMERAAEAVSNSPALRAMAERYERERLRRAELRSGEKKRRP